MSMRFALVGAAVVFASTLFGQRADSTQRSTLDDVTVTANKMLQKQSQTGKVVSIISREQIEKSAGRTVAQLLNEQAGITINGALSNAGTNQTLYMRGANSGRTLILVDGIPVYDPSVITNDFDLNLISLNDVERVEICRGAQSTLYGSDAVAGVINIITVKKDVSKLINVKATGSYGNLNTFRGNLQVYGKAGKLTYTTRYAKLKTDGFSAAQDLAGDKNFEKDGYNSDAVNAAIQYQASAKWLLKTFIQRNQYTSDIDAGAYNDERDYTLKNKNLMAGTGFQYKGENITVTGNYQYSEIDRFYRNDSTHVPGFSKYSEDAYYGRNQFLELFTNINLGKGFSTVYGVDYRFSNMNNRFLSISSFGPFTSSFRDTSVSQASAYGSVLFQHKGLFIELGGRLNVHDRYGSNATYTFNPSYSINQHFRVFGSIATGFKAPSLYQMYSSYGNLKLKAEESKNYELGLQQTHGRINNRVVYFDRDIDNGLDFNNNTFRYFNIVKQRVKGLEIESSVGITKDVKFTANYTLLSTQEIAQSRVTFKDTTYNYLLRRPKHSLNATAGWQITKQLYASVTGKYASKRYDVGGYKVKDVALDSYFIVNAYAEYKLNEQVRFFADAQNLTNKTFYEARGFNAIPFVVNAGVTVQL